MLTRAEVKDSSKKLLSDIAVAVVRQGIRSVTHTPKEATRSSFGLAFVALAGAPAVPYGTKHCGAHTWGGKLGEQLETS